MAEITIIFSDSKVKAGLENSKKEIFLIFLHDKDGISLLISVSLFDPGGSH